MERYAPQTNEIERKTTANIAKRRNAFMFRVSSAQRIAQAAQKNRPFKPRAKSSVRRNLPGNRVPHPCGFPGTVFDSSKPAASCLGNGLFHRNFSYHP